MRTTIELAERHRSFLLATAAERGTRGYSALIQEALDHYISCKDASLNYKQELLRMKGSWSREEANDVRGKIKEVRKNWQTS